MDGAWLVKDSWEQKGYNACMEVAAMEEKMTDEQFETLRIP